MARTVADRLTQAVVSGDVGPVAGCCSPDAVLAEGTSRARGQISELFRAWFEPFSEPPRRGRHPATGRPRLRRLSLSCTGSGPLTMPTGETVPATAGRVTLRGADVCTVAGGAVVEHHLYYDQVELLGQLGLLAD